MPGTNGEQTVSVQFRDAAGNVSPPISDTIILDTVAPVNRTVMINGGAIRTNNPTVDLALSATNSLSGVDFMQVSMSPYFTGAIWEPYATAKSITLSSTNGTRYVYARFKDAAGNISAAVSDSIILDTKTALLTITHVVTKVTLSDKMNLPRYCGQSKKLLQQSKEDCHGIKEKTLYARVQDRNSKADYGWPQQRNSDCC